MISAVNATDTMTLVAQYAIVLFGQEPHYSISSQFRYATAHVIKRAGNCRTLGEGTPLSADECVKALYQLLGAAEIEVLPSRVLAVAPNFLSWWCPPGNRPTWFSDQCGGSLKGRHGTIPHPGIIFTVLGQSMFVRCTRGSNRPEPEDKLFEVPHFNVWESGQVCVGNVDFPNTPKVEEIRTYEECFFQSYWTHSNAQKRVVKYKGGSTRLWLDLLDGKFDSFPEHLMIEADQSVQQYIQGIGRKVYARS